MKLINGKIDFVQLSILISLPIKPSDFFPPSLESRRLRKGQNVSLSELFSRATICDKPTELIN